MPQMPEWLQWILGAGAVIGALAVIWTKFLQPLGKLITYMHQMLPLLSTLTAQFKDDPDYLGVLSEIAAQFKADSGSTLRDVVNRLEASATESKDAAKELRIKAGVLEENVAIVKELASKDRAEASHKLVLLDDVLARMKHFEGLLSAQSNQLSLQASISPQQLVPPSQVISAPQIATQPITQSPPQTDQSQVIAIVEARKVE